MYRYGLALRLNINTKPCFAEKQATAAQIFPLSFVCILGNYGPFSVLSSSLFAFPYLTHSSDAIPAIATCLPSANLCILPHHLQLTMHLDYHAITHLQQWE
jgi:hypothetical protein